MKKRVKTARDSRAWEAAASVESVEAEWSGKSVKGPRAVILVRRVRRVKPDGGCGMYVIVVVGLDMEMEVKERREPSTCSEERRMLIAAEHLLCK